MVCKWTTSTSPFWHFVAVRLQLRSLGTGKSLSFVRAHVLNQSPWSPYASFTWGISGSCYCRLCVCWRNVFSRFIACFSKPRVQCRLLFASHWCRHRWSCFWAARFRRNVTRLCLGANRWSWSSVFHRESSLLVWSRHYCRLAASLCRSIDDTRRREFHKPETILDFERRGSRH